jgi:hypothetical protein
MPVLMPQLRSEELKTLLINPVVMSIPGFFLYHARAFKKNKSVSVVY